MDIIVHGKRMTLTLKTIQATRQWYADNAMTCIAEVESGEVKVSDSTSYREWRLQSAADSLAGKNDHTFAFAQRALFIQTGESVPLLS